jgi:hypothetical protein
VSWLVALTAPAIGLVIAVHTAASSWERVKTRPEKRMLAVTGSATQRIVSDLIEWSAVIETKNADRTAAYRALRAQVAAALDYLREHGIATADVRVSSVETRELVETEYLGVGDQRVERRVSKGWSTRQVIRVRSNEIAKVEKVSREITELLEKGIQIASEPPSYHYTKLDEVKVDMLAKAAANARERARRIVEAGGGAALGALWNADMGVINVNPSNATATSWEGNNDKTSLEKDIITIVHLTFELP